MMMMMMMMMTALELVGHRTLLKIMQRLLDLLSAQRLAPGESQSHHEGDAAHEQNRVKFN